jgi:hypothetical protein
MAMRRPTLRAATHKKMQFLEQKSRRRKYLHPRLKLPNLALQYSRDLGLAKWVFRGHYRMRDVRFGSLADISTHPINVRFHPKSGHSATTWVRLCE